MCPHFLPLTAHAAIDKVLPFSAKLKSAASGEIVPDGNYSIAFSFYSVASEGTALWTENQTVSVTQGIFSINLGTNTPFPASLTFNDGQYYLGIKVGSDAEMAPRRRLGAIPVALNSDTVDGAHAGTGANNVLLLDSSGNINIQGGITVGSPILPATNGTINIGSSTAKFGTIYANSISAGTTEISGTTSESFAINTDNATNNIENSAVRFYLGPTLNTWAALQWNGPSNRFDLFSRVDSSTVASLNMGALTATSGTLSSTLAVTGATTLSSTLGVTGAATLNSTLAVAGNTTITGDLAVNGGDITSTATTVNIDIGNTGTLNIRDGANNLISITDNGTTGNMTVTGTLNSAGAFIASTTANVVGDFSVNTNKLTVAATTGNTSIAGTLNVTGNTGLSTLSTSGLATLNSASITGAATVGTTLGVTGLSTLGQLTVNGNSTTGDTDITLGDAVTDQIVINGSVASALVPLTDNTYNLGSPTKRWANFYAANAVFDQLSTPNTTANDFFINSDNATADTEDMTLQFERGTTTPNAVIGWNSTSDYLYANQNFIMQGNTTFGDASGDTVTSAAAAWTFSNATTVALATSTTALNFASNLLNLDTTNRRVGIGTANPTSILHVHRPSGSGVNTSVRFTNQFTGTSSTSGFEVGVSDSDFYTAMIWQYSANPILFATNNTERVRIDSSGNVGIGTDPTHKLQVVGTSTTANVAGLHVSQTGAITGTGYGGYFSKTGASTTNVGLYATATGATNNYAAIFASGRVGIGTAAPYNLFQVGDGSGDTTMSLAADINSYNKILFTTGANAAFQAIASHANNGTLDFGLNGTARFGAHNAGILAGTPYLAINGNGIGIGTSPTSRLHVEGNLSATSWTTTGILLQAAAATYTDTSGTGTIGTRVANSFAASTFASSNAVTLTNAATLYVAGAPTAGTNTTITNAYGILSNGRTKLIAGTLPANSIGLDFSATLSGSSTGDDYGIRSNVTTTAGSSSTGIYGNSLALEGSYTGGTYVIAAYLYNAVAGTGTSIVGGGANYGSYSVANATTAGTNVAVYGDGGNGNINIGVSGSAARAKNGATNIGVMGRAANTGTTPVVVGGWFSLGGTVPTTSAALLINNAAIAADIFRAEDNGSTVFTIADGGNVAIGSQTPTTKLDVAGGALFSSTAGGTTGHTKILSSPTVAGTGGLLISQIAAYTAGTGAFKLYAADTGGLAGLLHIGHVNQGTPDTIGTPIMTLKAGGNVGIGTSDPQTLLHLYGASPVLRIADNGSTGLAELAFYDTTTQKHRLRLTAANSLQFSYGATDLMALSSGGNLGIGVTGPTRKLEVNMGTLAADVVSPGVYFYGTAHAVGTQHQTGFTVDLTSAGSQAGITQRAGYFTLGGGYTGSFYTSGLDITNAAAATGASESLHAAFTTQTGNFSVQGYSIGTTTGNNYGVYMDVSGGNKNFGVIGKAAGNKANATNIGVLGTALNANATGPIHVGGYFGLLSGTPTYTSAALIANNGAQTSPIFLAQDNGSTVFSIIDGGNLTSTASSVTLSSAAAVSLASSTTALNFGSNLLNLDTTNSRVGIGTNAPATYLHVKSAAGAGFNDHFIVGDADVDHGIGYGDTNTFYLLTQYGSLAGGATQVGLSDLGTIPGMSVVGVMGSDDPTDTVSAILLTGQKKNGAGVQALGSLETVLHVENGAQGSGTKLLTVLGNGNVGIGTTTPTTSKLHVVAGTVAASGKAINVTSTNADTAGTFDMNQFIVTGAGTLASQLSAVRGELLGGYTGGGYTIGGYFLNGSAGTGTSYIGANGNYSVYGATHATTTGTNTGGFLEAYGGNTNVGFVGSATRDKNSATNAGVIGLGYNGGTSPTMVGGIFALRNTAPAIESAALIADNGATTHPIFLGRDNGVTVFTIADGGHVTVAANFTLTGKLITTPSAVQTITAATQAVTVGAASVQIKGDASGPYTLTSAPTIADGVDGQHVYIIGNDSTKTITIQDEGTLANSNIELATGVTSRTLGLGDSLHLVFSTAKAGWIEVAYTNVD